MRQGDPAMETIVGITLALCFCAAAARLGMDRERVRALRGRRALPKWRRMVRRG